MRLEGFEPPTSWFVAKRSLLTELQAQVLMFVRSGCRSQGEDVLGGREESNPDLPVHSRACFPLHHGTFVRRPRTHRADAENRTPDLRFTRAPLYLLSYVGMARHLKAVAHLEPRSGIEPLTSRLPCACSAY